MDKSDGWGCCDVHILHPRSPASTQDSSTNSVNLFEKPYLLSLFTRTQRIINKDTQHLSQAHLHVGLTITHMGSNKVLLDNLYITYPGKDKTFILG